MVSEIWTPVFAWENHYEVSSLGNVRSKRTGRTLKPGDNGNGYLMVVLWVNAKKPGERKRTAKVHRLVLESFTGTMNKGMQAAHRDGNRKNNKLSNLEWLTVAENHGDKKRHGTNKGRKGVKRDKLTAQDAKEILKLSSEGMSIVELAKKFNVHQTNISHIRCGRIWKNVTL
jgi:ribosome-binding protein aMBF1 (putative translation factor)